MVPQESILQLLPVLFTRDNLLVCAWPQGPSGPNNDSDEEQEKPAVMNGSMGATLSVLGVRILLLLSRLALQGKVVDSNTGRNAVGRIMVRLFVNNHDAKVLQQLEPALEVANYMLGVDLHRRDRVIVNLVIRVPLVESFGRRDKP
jgi:hypothetical protein